MLKSKNKKRSYPLSREAEERVDQRSEVGVSRLRRASAVMSAGLTHPVIALLDHPLFACGGKRVTQEVVQTT
ncbi:MAG TPA: hypothetical protein VFE53_07980 [Mucilaginibacter sp.]|jgi:hypothetical protein|nr:hypothetical protein [Mucilaginibacter sp.]